MSDRLTNQLTAERQSIEVIDTRRPAPVPEPLAWTPPASDVGNVFMERWLILRRHLLKLVGFILATVLLTGIYLFRAPKLYDAVAQVRVDPNLQTNPVGTSQSQLNLDEVDALLATEKQEVESATVTVPVLKQLNVQEDPNLNISMNDRHKGPVVDGIYQRVLDAFDKSLTVVHPPATFLLNISFRSRSPEFSATVANALANQLIQHEYETRSQSLRNSSQYLTAQLNDIRAKMEQSQTALSAFEHDNGVVAPDDKFNLMNQRLSTIATDLDTQRAKQRQLNAEMALVKTKNLDDIIASGQGTTLRPLMEALAAQQVTFASIAAKYGPGDPLYREAQRRLDRVQAALNSEVQHVGRQIEAQAATQAIRVKMTQTAFDAQKQQLDAFNDKAAQYLALKQQAQAEQTLYQNLLQRIQDANVSAGYHSDSLRIVSSARPNPRPAAPKILLGLLASLFTATVIGIAFIFGLSSLDRTLSDPSQIETSLGQRLLGSLPELDQVAPINAFWGVGEPGKALNTASQRTSGYAEAVFSLRTALLFGPGGRMSNVAFTSAQPRDGKTTTSTSFAVACARNGVQTLLIDADMRRPSVHRALRLPNRIGLSQILQETTTIDEALQEGPIPNLTILSAGLSCTNSPELLANRFAPILEELKARFEYVIIDCPPVLGFADSLIIGAVADSVVIVARAGDTPRHIIRATIDQIQTVRANIIGIVLNGVSASMSEYYQYFHSYDSYYRNTDDTDA